MPVCKDQILACSTCTGKVHGKPRYGLGALSARVLIINSQPVAEVPRRLQGVHRLFYQDLNPPLSPTEWLFRELLSTLGLDLGEVYVTQALKCYPLQQKEGVRLACRPHLEAEIAQLCPVRYVTLGTAAAWSYQELFPAERRSFQFSVLTSGVYTSQAPWPEFRATKKALLLPSLEQVIDPLKFLKTARLAWEFLS